MTWKSLITSVALRAACATVLCTACASEDDDVTVAGSGVDGGAGVVNRPDSGTNPGNNTGNNGAGKGAGCGLVDLLFVIDNSGSMAEEQAGLAQNFPRMITVLDALKGGSVNYRVGVTTTSISENGALQKTSDMQHPWLDRGEGNLSARFAKLAQVGITGSGLEQPLSAARAALTTRIADGANAGFLRPNALLAIVILTDEDDGSSDPNFLGGLGALGIGPEEPVPNFLTAFDGVVGARGNWATAVIAGDRMGGCESSFGEANYAERLVDFVKQTGPNAVMGSICSGDLAGELDKALNTFTNACEAFVPLF